MAIKPKNYKKSIHKYSKGREFKSLTKEEKREIFEKIRKEKRKNILIISIVVLFATIFTAYASYHLINSFGTTTNSLDIAEMQKKQAEKKEAFEFYMSDAEKWFYKKDWHNAIFQYKMAVKTAPNNYDAQLMLGYAYFNQCKFEHVGCLECQNQINILINNFRNEDRSWSLADKFKTLINDRKLEE